MTTLKIDMVSDIVCPWCVIGLRGLEVALERLGPAVAADVHFHPFELNPDMPPEGENSAEHVARKYGATPEQSAASRDTIGERAEALGFRMAMGRDARIRNSFDAHRLLHWAGETGDAVAMKHALFEAYFTHGQDIADPAILADAAARAGFDREAALSVVTSDRYAEQVREAERYWRGEGVTAVPTFVVEGQYVISGGQPPEAFERALSRIAAEKAKASA